MKDFLRGAVLFALAACLLLFAAVYGSKASAEHGWVAFAYGATALLYVGFFCLALCVIGSKEKV